MPRPRGSAFAATRAGEPRKTLRPRNMPSCTHATRAGDAAWIPRPNRHLRPVRFSHRLTRMTTDPLHPSDVDPDLDSISSTASPHPALWALAGFAAGLFDLALLSAMDVQMSWRGADVRVAVVVFFALTFAALGYALGRVRRQGIRAERDRRVIATQLKTIEREAARAREAEALASVGRMAAGLAHEIRNPLAVIRSSASLVEDELGELAAGGIQNGEPADARRATVMIREEVARLDGLITKLLGFARPAAAVRVETTLGEVVESALRVAREAGASPEIDANFDTTIFVDQGLIGAALSALALNAAQHATLVRVEADVQGGALTLDVADDGPGVAEAVRSDLFRPFVTTRADGTGLGLATAKKLVEAHGGQLIYVEGDGLAAGGRGARFRIQIDAGTPTHVRGAAA